LDGIANYNNEFTLEENLLLERVDFELLNEYIENL